MIGENSRQIDSFLSPDLSFKLDLGRRKKASVRPDGSRKEEDVTANDADTNSPFVLEAFLHGFLSGLAIFKQL